MLLSKSKLVSGLCGVPSMRDFGVIEVSLPQVHTSLQCSATSDDCPQ